jgi:hypothetical protein
MTDLDYVTLETKSIIVRQDIVGSYRIRIKSAWLV